MINDVERAKFVGKLKSPDLAQYLDRDAQLCYSTWKKKKEKNSGAVHQEPEGYESPKCIQARKKYIEKKLEKLKVFLKEKEKRQANVKLWEDEDDDDVVFVECVE
jgi:hypothetical protein